MDQKDDQKALESFTQLLVSNQRKIQAFILVLVQNVADAEDVYQETMLEMWNKFHSFEIGTDFVAWANAIARNKAFTFRKKYRSSRMLYNDRVYDILGNIAEKRINVLNDHIDVLTDCIQKLSHNEIFFLKLRYENDMTFQKISSILGKTPPAIYHIMSVIHSKLALCVRRVLRLEEII